MHAALASPPVVSPSTTTLPLAFVGLASDPAVIAELLTELEIIGRPVWLSRTCRTRSAVLRGVPGKRLSFLIDERLLEPSYSWDPRDTVGIEIEQRNGCYDSATRPNIIIRGYTNNRAGAGGPDSDRAAIIAVSRTADDHRGCGNVEVTVTTTWGDTWQWVGRSLQTVAVDSPAKILLWHWRQSWWSVPLPASDEEIRKDVEAMAATPDTWAPEDPAATVAGWNRAAERALYRLARARGWRKLTQRERDRLGLTGGAWVHEAAYSEAQMRLYSGGRERQWPHARPAPWVGVGEHTLDESAAGPIRRVRYEEDEEDERVLPPRGW